MMGPQPGRAVVAVGLLTVVLSSWGCAGAPRAPVHDLSSIGSDEVVVVGQVELDPPLDKGEQNLKTIGSGRYRNRVFLMADERWRVIDGQPRVSDYQGRIEATFGEMFYVKSPDRPFYILGGMILIQSAMNQPVDQAFLPGGLKVDLRPGDKAVYVGTVRYHRNEYFDITKITIRDDYERANAKFRQKFGGAPTLRKRLATPIKG